MCHALVALVMTVGADDDLARVLKPVTGAESYVFSLKQGPGPGVEGTYQKGSPVHFVADRLEFYREGDTLVYRQGDTWQRTRTGRLSDPLPILGASARVKAARLPHDELAEVAAKAGDVRKSMGKDGTVYTGTLPEKAAKELARTEDRDLARSGTVTIRVDAKGRVSGYEISIELKGRRGNADVDGTVTRSVTVKDIGTAKVDVPAAAKKALQ